MPNNLQEKENQDSKLTLFALTWAIATLFHYQAFDKWDQGYVVWLAAVWLIFKPSSLSRFILLIFLQIAQEILILPEKHNHWLFVTIVNMTILSAFVIQVIKEKTVRSINTHLFLKRFTPFVCLELIILYFFAVFHKLNYDYFDPDVSCGSFFYQTQSTRFSFLPGSCILEVVTIYATIFFEVLIPLLLLNSRSRNLGILVALLFHGIIGFNPTSEFWNFSSVVYAILVLFAPADFASRCFVKKYPISRTVALISLIVAIAISVIIKNPQFEVGFGLALWALYMVSCIALFIHFLRGSRLQVEENKYKEQLFQFHSLFLFIFPLFLFFNGMSPYLGLKTESSFAMFSNLRTEGGRSNHMLMSNSWQMFDFQKDLVEIKSSSDSYLNGLVEKKLLLTYFDFHKYAQAHPEMSATYMRNSQLYDLAIVRETEEFKKQPPWYQRTFLVFRPVSTDSKTSCTR